MNPSTRLGWLFVPSAVGCTPRGGFGDTKKDEPDAMRSPTCATPHVIAIAASVARATHLVVLLHGVGADAEPFQDIGRALARVASR